MPGDSRFVARHDSVGRGMTRLDARLATGVKPLGTQQKEQCNLDRDERIMVNRRPAKQQLIPKSVIIVGVLIAGIGLTYGIVRAAGWLDRSAPLTTKPSREGLVPVPKSLANLKAFEVVQREDVYDRTLGSDSYFWLPKKQVDDHPEWFTSVDDIIGRVMARDKRAEFVFSKKDFLPEGSRSGIAGGIPAGKQGFFLDVESVAGLRFLKAGDRFDLLASLPDESLSSVPEYGTLMGGIKAQGGKPVPLSGVRVLVQNAEMIALTTSRNMTTQGGLQLSSGDGRARSNNIKDERVAIAIDPSEAVPLTQALGENVAIQMVTRSGQESGDVSDANLLMGRIAMPASAVSIGAYQPIRASDLAEPNTGELRQYYFQPTDIQDGWIARPEELVGRVVRRAIEPGYIFSENDFLPVGALVRKVDAYERITPEDLVGGGQTQWVGRVAARDLDPGTTLADADLFPPGVKPGLSAAIPPDRMAMTIEESDIRGASQLRRGDHCDLLAAIPVDIKKSLQGVQLSPALQSDFQSKTLNRVLAIEALVVQELEDQVVLATRPDEVSQIAKALAQETPVFCVIRKDGSQKGESLTPSATEESPERLVSDPDPMREIAITETLVGGDRTVRAYRRTP